MALLFWVVRFLVLLLIVRFVVGMVRQAMRASSGGPAPRVPKRPAERIGGTLVQDPQCGTYLPRDRALSVSAGGSTQYFCSDKCRDAWAAGGGRSGR